MSHTPGPWKLGRFGVIQSSRGREAFNGIAYPQIALATLDDRSDEERDANARLIAAVPQLLSALNDCVAWMMRDAGQTDNLPELRNAVDAIAKATGGAA